MIQISLIEKSFPLKPIQPRHHNQLLLAEVEYLQVTTSLHYLKQHIANIKASGRDASGYQCIIDNMEKIGLDLWGLPEEKYKLGGRYKTYKKSIIQKGLIHVWNKHTATFETRINYLKQRSFDGPFVKEEDSYVSSPKNSTFYK